MNATIKGNNIALIGMPGCGKSSVGGKMELGRPRIEREFGKLKVIDTDGLMKSSVGEGQFKSMLRMEFLFLERKILLDLGKLLDKGGHNVISTGGSAVYSGQAMDYLKEISIIVYLEASLKVLEGRLSSTPIEERGIVDLGTRTLGEIYEERNPLYEKWAEVRINSDLLSVDAIVEKITSLWGPRKERGR